jgi:hypothetical protein
MITVPSNQLRVLDGLVDQGAASTRSALLQQIISAFIAEVNQMRRSKAQPYEQPHTIEGAVEALAAYFLYSLGKTVIDSLFGVNK